MTTHNEFDRTPIIYELSLMTLLSMSSHSSVDRAPVRCSGGHGFDSCRELRIFSLSHAHVMLINSPSHSDLTLITKAVERSFHPLHFPQ